MIKPELGMPVLYHQQAGDHFAGGETLAATITRVWSDGMVNLTVFDGDGLAQNRTSVLLHQGDDGQPNPVGGRWCQFPNWFLCLMVPPRLIVNPGFRNDAEAWTVRAPIPMPPQLPDGSISPIVCKVNR